MSRVSPAIMALAPSPIAEDPWFWPIDRSRYDRTPTLSTAEVAALTALGDDVRRWRADRSAFQVLDRLLHPLAAARAALAAPTTHCRVSADAAVAALLDQCAVARCS